MSNLVLFKSEMFGKVECDFYQDENDVLVMTSEQLGQALEYADPQKGISTLVSRNKYLEDEEFSSFLSLRGEAGTRETRVFTEDGIYEVTMLAKTEKAKEFRTWVRKVLKGLRSGQLKLVQSQPQTQAQLLVLYAQHFADQEKILMEHDRKITEVEAKVEIVKNVFAEKDEDWREMIKAKIKKIADVTGDYPGAWRNAYAELDRHGFRIGYRLTNRKKRMAEQGCSMSEIKKANNLDIIEEDSKAKEILTNIVSRMVLKHVI